MRRTVASCLFLLSACGLASAQEVKPPYDPQAAARTIAPFVDELTVAVARVDLRRLDANGLFDKVDDLLQQTGDREAKQLAEARKSVTQFVSFLTGAGVRELYAVVSLADLPEVKLLVLPLYEGTDPNRLSSLLEARFVPASQPIGPLGPDGHGRETTTVIGKALVLARPAILNRLRAMTKPADRPELAKAFAAAGDTTAQLLILPTDDARRVVEDMLPELPKQLGGGPSKVLTRGVLWAGIGADGPPKMRLIAAAQSESPEAATAFQAAFSKIVATALAAGLGGPEKAKALIPDLDKYAAMLSPKADGDRLSLSLSDKQLGDLISGLVAPALQRARQQARRVMSMTHIKTILAACHVYRANHKDAWPEDLKALLDGKLLAADLLKRPDQPDMKDGYVYVRPGAKFDPQQLVVYEQHDAWPGMVAVGFADGHVEQIANEARFKELLAKAAAALKSDE